MDTRGQRFLLGPKAMYFFYFFFFEYLYFEAKVSLGLIIRIRDGFCHYQRFDGDTCRQLRWVPLLHMHLAFCWDCRVHVCFLRRLDFVKAYRQGAGGAASYAGVYVQVGPCLLLAKSKTV